MLNHHVVQLPAIQNMGDVFKKHPGDSLIYRVHQDGFFVHEDVGIVGDASGDGINAFKQGKTAVVAANPGEILRNFLYTIHFVINRSFPRFSLL